MTKTEYFYAETGKHIRNVQVLMQSIAGCLINRSRNHDVSKYDDAEKDLFIGAVPRLAGELFGSERYRAIVDEIRPAVERHNRFNPHHPEHFPQGIGGMSLVDMTEMLCDWVAAAKRNPGGDIEKSVSINQKRFGFGDEIKQLLLITARRLEYSRGILEEHCPWPADMPDKPAVPAAQAVAEGDDTAKKKKEGETEVKIG